MTRRDAYHLIAGALLMATVTAASVPWDVWRIFVSLVAVVVFVLLMRAAVAETRRGRSNTGDARERR